MSNRYYITPTRLTRNPVLWRSIKLMVTLKPDQEIFVPETTIDWLRSGSPENWTIISPENAALCIERYDRRNLQYRWDNNPAATEKIFDILLQGDNDNKAMVLGNHLIKEETLTLFIEKVLPSLVKASAINDKTVSIYSVTTLRSRVENLIKCILRNTTCKTYQIELLWKLLHPEVNVAATIMECISKVDMVPDYILTDMIKSVSDPKYRLSYYGSNEVTYIKEGFRRHMIVQVTPTTIVVPSQPRPVSFVKPTVPTISVTL